MNNEKLTKSQKLMHGYNSIFVTRINLEFGQKQSVGRLRRQHLVNKLQC